MAHHPMGDPPDGPHHPGVSAHHPPAPTLRHAVRSPRAAARVKGLETLIVCWRGDQASTSARAPLAVVTVWLDAEAMLAAIGRDEGRFLSERLGLDVEADRRIVRGHEPDIRVAAAAHVRPPNRPDAHGARADTGLFERLREIQRWLTDHGLIASHVARRVTDDGVEALVVGVWIDRDAIETATLGRPDQTASPTRSNRWSPRGHCDLRRAGDRAPPSDGIWDRPSWSSTSPPRCRPDARRRGGPWPNPGRGDRDARGGPRRPWRRDAAEPPAPGSPRDLRANRRGRFRPVAR